jgi:hypothetical protein
MNDGRYEAACPKLEESQRLDPAGGTLLHIALCYEGAGKTASAWTAFHSALSAAVRDGRADREQVARERIGLIEPKLAKLTIVVRPDAARLPAFRVTRDGLVVADAQWGTPVPIDPGHHTIAATASGRTPWSQGIDVGAGPASVRVEVPLLGGGRRALAPVAHEPGRSGSSQRAVALVLGGVGVAAAVVGAAFGIIALERKADAEPYCNAQNVCDDTGLALEEEGVVAGNVSTVAFVGAAAFLAAGVVVFATAPTSGGQSARATRMRLGPTGLAVTRGF